MGSRRKYSTYFDLDASGFFVMLLNIAVIASMKLLPFFDNNVYGILVAIQISFLLSAIILYFTHYNDIKYYFSDLKKDKAINKIGEKTILANKIRKLNNDYELYPTGVFNDTYDVLNKEHILLANMDDYLLMTIDRRYEDLKRYKLKYDDTVRKYTDYCKKYDELKQYITLEEAQKLRMNFEKYKKYQLILLEESKIKIKIEFAINVIIRYATNKGTLQQAKSQVFYKDEFKKALDTYFDLRKQNKTYEINVKIEKPKMNDQLKNDVLKRDGYRCQICEATERDGAELLVDYIVPLEKNGKTEPRNLQVLCTRCKNNKG